MDRGHSACRVRQFFGVLVASAAATGFAARPFDGKPDASAVSAPVGEVVAKLSAGGKRTIDVQGVRTEDQAVCVFHLVNDTGSAVAVTRIRPSCGCTSATISKPALSPGDSADLTARIATDQYEGEQTVSVRVDGMVGGKPAQFDFTITVHVSPVFEMPTSRFRIDAGRLDIGNAPPTYEMQVVRGGNPLEWDALSVGTDSAQAAASAVSDGAGRWRVRLQLDPRRRLGPLAVGLTLRAMKAGSDTGYAVTREISATIVGPVRAAPGSWLIGQAHPGRVAERQVHILSSGSSDERPEFVNATASDAKAIVVAKDPAAKDRFVVRYRPPEKPGPDSGYVDARVSTLHGAYTIRIPYLALVVSPTPPTAAPTPASARPEEPDGSGGPP